MEYLLLDRDPRWKKLLGAKRFKQFELSQPRQMRFPYDVVFCDPPFANIALPGGARSLSTPTTCHAPSRSSVSRVSLSPPVKITCRIPPQW